MSLRKTLIQLLHPAGDNGIFVDHLYTCVCVCSQEARCGYAIALMALYWCTECMPLAVTALLPVILFPMMGIMKASEVQSFYFCAITGICVAAFIGTCREILLLMRIILFG